MPRRIDETTTNTRQLPQEYRAEYDVDNQVIYEAWADPGTDEGSLAWCICKHTYTSNNLTKTEWAGNADFDKSYTNRAAYF